MFRIIRIIYLFKLEYILQKRFNETVRYSYKLSIYLLAMISLSTSAIMEIENNHFRKQYGPLAIKPRSSQQNKKALDTLFRFHDMIYFELSGLSKSISPSELFGINGLASINDIFEFFGVEGSIKLIFSTMD